MEIAIVAKAKQGYIYRYMLENNITAAELARRLGISASSMGAIINFKWIPPQKRKIQGGYVDKLESYFNLPIEMLFPPELTKGVAEKLGRKHTHFQDVEILPLNGIQPKYLSYDPGENEKKEEQIILLQKALKTLTRREEDIIKKAYGLGENPIKRADLAKEYNVSVARIRQIIKKALNKLKHPKQWR